MPIYNYDKAVARAQYLWVSAAHPSEKVISDQIGYPRSTIKNWRAKYGWDIMRAAKHFDDLVAVYRALGVDPEITAMQALRTIRQIFEVCDIAISNERKAYDPRTKICTEALGLMRKCWELQKEIMDSVPHEKLRKEVEEMLKREEGRLLDYEKAQKMNVEF